MSDTIRTIVYIFIAAAALLLAWIVKPAAVAFETVDDSGERFFAQFDPL
jgi:hypothetical protein